MYNDQQQYFAQQYKEAERRQRQAYNDYQRQLAAYERNYAREVERQQKEWQKLDMKYSKYPNLTDNFIKECITYEIYEQLTKRGVNVPEPAVLISKLKFRRIKAEAPMPYTYRGKKAMCIKHACKFSGVTLNRINPMRVVYRSPNGSRYDHDYNYVLPYFYCSKCKAVIYYFNG